MAMVEWFRSGGFAMYPLVACSIIVWVVAIERILRLRRFEPRMNQFKLEATNLLLRKDSSGLKALCAKEADLPTAKILSEGIARLGADSPELQKTWKSHLDRQRLLENQELKRYLWMIGSIGAVAPFIGLFGTVVGILQSFGEIARTGTGGFAVVAGGISEALVATAAGIVVAVMAVVLYNAFQVQVGRIALLAKVQIEELREMIDSAFLRS